MQSPTARGRLAGAETSPPGSFSSSPVVDRDQTTRRHRTYPQLAEVNATNLRAIEFEARKSKKVLFRNGLDARRSAVQSIQTSAKSKALIGDESKWHRAYDFAPDQYLIEPS